MAYLRYNGKMIDYNGQYVISPSAPEPTNFSVWYLPSMLEAAALDTELFEYAVGTLSGQYWTSSESVSNPAEYPWSMGTGYIPGPIANVHTKATVMHVRAVRSFEAEVGAYAIRDVGPGGGYVFGYTGGKYYEECGMDLGASLQAWSNIINAAAGASGNQFGDGLANTIAIINQVGHISSAALTAYNYTV